jgi:hypothetical protein
LSLLPATLSQAEPFLATNAASTFGQPALDR